MAFEIRLNEDARADLTEAVEWYETQKKGLGMHFFQTVSDTRDKITINPTHYGTYFQNCRDVAFAKFPFEIVFQIQENAIAVIAIFDTRKNEFNLTRRMQ